MDFSTRSTLPELMDDEALPEADYQRCLRDLAAVNRVTFTHRATLRWLDRATRGWVPGATVSVLDVAYGDGDLLRAMARWAAKRGFSARLVGVDLNPRSAIAARAATPAWMAIDYRTGDVFDFVPDAPLDFIVTSQFTHHLPDDAVVRLLRWMEGRARRGWYVADLHRHAFAYYGFPLLARLMRWHPIVRHDGAVSIARGFTRAEWARLLGAAGLQADISWHVAFRYGIGRIK